MFVDIVMCVKFWFVGEVLMTEFHSYTSSVCYRRHLPLKGKAWFYVNSERLLLEERLRRMAVVRCSHDSGVNNILNGQSGCETHCVSVGDWHCVATPQSLQQSVAINYV